MNYIYYKPFYSKNLSFHKKKSICLFFNNVLKYRYAKKKSSLINAKRNIMWQENLIEKRKHTGKKNLLTL